MIEGYMYQYAVIIQHSPGYGDDELDEEYLTQEDAEAAKRSFEDLAQAHWDEVEGMFVKASYRIEWRWHT